MRVRLSVGSIYEVYDVCVMPGGLTNDSGKFYDMSCILSMRYEDTEYGEITGEFDVSNCTTIEECEEIVKPFFDELFKNGFIDLSTDEKLKKYKLSID